MEKQYQIESITELVNLWTNNTTFRKQVGPTLGHLRKWLFENKFSMVYMNYIRSSTATLSYDRKSTLDMFLIGSADYKDAEQYLTPYFKHEYMLEDGSYDVYKMFTTKDIANFNVKLTYAIKNKIRMDKCSGLFNNKQIDVVDLYELFELGYVDINNLLKNRIDCYSNRVLLCKYKQDGCKHFEFNFYKILHSYRNLCHVFNLMAELFFTYKQVDCVWDFSDTTTVHNQNLMDTCKRLADNRHNINTNAEIVQHIFIENGTFIDNGSVNKNIFCEHMAEVINNTKLDVNKKSSSGLYLLQHIFRVEGGKYVSKLLDLGANIFDENDKLLKNSDNIPLTLNGYIYPILNNYYKDNQSMLDKIKAAYANNNVSTTATGSAQTGHNKLIITLIEEDPFVDQPELKKIFDKITDQKIKDKLLLSLSKNKN